MAIWTLTDPTVKPVVDSIRSILKAKVDEYDSAIAARNAAKGGVTRSYRNLLNVPLTDECRNVVDDVKDNVLEMVKGYDVPSGSENYYAHMAQFLTALAKEYTDLATLWSESVTVPDIPEHVMTDLEIQALAKECDDSFGLLMNNVKELEDHKNDAEAQSMIESTIGVALIAKRQSDGTVRYQLDIDRVRIPKAKVKGATENTVMTMTVDDSPMHEEGTSYNFGAEVDMAFSLKATEFLSQFGEQNPGWSFGETYSFDHDECEWSVRIDKIEA